MAPRLASTTRLNAETSGRQDNGETKEIALKTRARSAYTVANYIGGQSRGSIAATKEIRHAWRAAESGSGRERSKREDGCEDRGDFVGTGLGDARPMIRFLGTCNLRAAESSKKNKEGRTTHGEEERDRERADSETDIWSDLTRVSNYCSPR